METVRSGWGEHFSTVYPNALLLTVLITVAGVVLCYILEAMMAFHVVAAVLPGFGALGTNYVGRHEGGWNVNILVTAICSLVLLWALLSEHLGELIEQAQTVPESLIQGLIVATMVFMIAWTMGFVKRNIAD